MKLNMVAYLAKSENVIEDIVNTSSNPIYHPIDVSNLNGHLFLKQSPSTPEWSNLFSGADIPPGSFAQRTVKGLFVLEVEERYLAFTFGHGRSLLNKHCIERGFGLRVAMNLGDPRQLKSIDKSTLDKVALNTRSQSSKNTGVEDFSFEFDHEIMKSITAIVDREDEELEIISGKDSVAIYTEISFGMIGSLARRLIEAYEAEVYKENYPWAEYITPETDPELKSILDTLLVNALNTNSYDEFWMCAPELIDYTDFSGFRYNTKSDSTRYTELNLSSFIAGAGFRGDISPATLKSKKVYILNSTETEIDSWSFFQCISGELEHEGNKFILNDGTWYSVSDDFYLEVCNYFSQIPHSNLTFPSYGGLKEGPYLRSVCNDVDLALLDQKWVRPHGVANNLEFCDLYSNCKAIIHVKKYGSSAVLNHLFAQAYQSIEMLVNSPEVIEQVNEHLSETRITLSYDGTAQREHRIVLAIMDHRTGDLDIPFFAKVNLRHHCRKITGMGFNVELAKIPIGGVVFNNEQELRALLEKA
ncbi:TIGR04141 family sporadically distributed protein [Thalassomonas viridans]|uniref:TIGR04141 family sporadically distributed protein n=1 Tax=Thalassomonas viridans TaxID=137584 RepID=A0AAF0CDR4_9GAMM|nr:TIGR04141 family sporadically distributed protein [Thalassomonas viridans]WDE08775.1 TIGR04141 family sporadically distributed protein [Thalassomonas viridans]